MRKLSEKFLETIKNDKRLCDLSDERSLGDGIWVYTVDGYCWEMQGQHTIHEDTEREMYRAVKLIYPCHCKECERGLIEQNIKNLSLSELVTLGDTFNKPIYGSVSDNGRELWETIKNIVNTEMSRRAKTIAR